MLDAYLTVSNKDGRIVLRRRLLQSRDSEAEIETEFTNLSWQGSSLLLEGVRNHYSGEAVIALP